MARTSQKVFWKSQLTILTNNFLNSDFMHFDSSNWYLIRRNSQNSYISTKLLYMRTHFPPKPPAAIFSSRGLNWQVSISKRSCKTNLSENCCNFGTFMGRQSQKVQRGLSFLEKSNLLFSKTIGCFYTFKLLIGIFFTWKELLYCQSLRFVLSYGSLISWSWQTFVYAWCLVYWNYFFRKLLAAFFLRGVIRRVVTCEQYSLMKICVFFLFSVETWLVETDKIMYAYGFSRCSNSFVS